MTKLNRDETIDREASQNHFDFYLDSSGGLMVRLVFLLSIFSDMVGGIQFLFYIV